MNLSPAYLEWQQATKEEGLQQGLQQGQRQGNRKFAQSQIW